ncbi:MAG: MBL fold metallo-hydrolase [Elusimicrobiota bacterium]
MAGLLALGQACFRRPVLKGPGDPELGLLITWHGHSCFTFEDSAGRVVLIDPFDETVGYRLPPSEADAVLITHSHFDHDAHALADVLKRRSKPAEEKAKDPEPERGGRRGSRRASRKPKPEPEPEGILASTGAHTVGGLLVTGIAGHHDDQEGRRHGSTRFYVWEMGGLRLAHLGDIGLRRLSAAQKEALADVDVLMIPVGGKTTVDAAGAADLVAQIRPRIVVPMHYGNRSIRFFEFDPVENFLDLFGRVRRLPQSSFRATRRDMPEETTIFVPALPGAK